MNGRQIYKNIIAVKKENPLPSSLRYVAGLLKLNKFSTVAVIFQYVFLSRVPPKMCWSVNCDGTTEVPIVIHNSDAKIRTPGGDARSTKRHRVLPVRLRLSCCSTTGTRASRRISVMAPRRRAYDVQCAGVNYEPPGRAKDHAHRKPSPPPRMRSPAPFLFQPTSVLHVFPHSVRLSCAALRQNLVHFHNTQVASVFH